MKERSGKLLLEGVMSGVIVGIACVVYLITLNQTDSKVLGGLLFSIALVTIIARQYALYTGRVGYIANYGKGGFVHVLKVLAANIIGLAITALLLRLAGINLNGISIETLATNTFNEKLVAKWYETFFLSFFCGILMYIAVDSSKQNISDGSKLLLLIGPVLWFVVATFEHSIANMGYFFLGNAWSLKAILYIVIMIIGNAAGAMSINWITRQIGTGSNN